MSASSNQTTAQSADARKVPGSEWFVIMMDEKGSTQEDDHNPDQILSRRARLFGRAIGFLAKELKGEIKDPRVIKNVGDALLIRCKRNDLPALLQGLLAFIDDSKERSTPPLSDQMTLPVRVAVHGGDNLAFFGEDNNVEDFIREMKAACAEITGCDFTEGLNKFWPGNSLVLEQDVFGPTINRTARLASIPDLPYLIVSKHVRDILNKLPVVDVEICEHPTALFSVRGISEYEAKKPWFVYQVRNRKGDQSETAIDARLFELEWEGSNAQTWRDVYLSFAYPTAGDDYQEAYSQVLAHFGGTEPLTGERTAAHYCVDAIYKTRERWVLAPFPTDRKVENSVMLPKSAMRRSETIEICPQLVTCTSTLDVKHDADLREYLSAANGETSLNNTWEVTVQTFDVHGRAHWLPRPLTSSWHARVKFLVGSKFLKDADQPDKYFPPKEFPPITTEANNTWVCESFGILKGVFDGFLMFTLAAEPREPPKQGRKKAQTIGQDFADALKRMVVAATKMHPDEPYKRGIYGRMIPVVVDILQPEGSAQNPIRFRKKKILQAVKL